MSERMRAVGYRTPSPIDHPESLVALELPRPTPGPRDLLVSVRATSVNPVDVKLRARATPPAGEARVLGFDAAGVVAAVGAEVRGFAAGDRVFYAGAIDRPGANAEFQLVDERIVGPAPRTLELLDAAALPLTALTAWELLFDRLHVVRDRAPVDAVLLVVGGAGGVGSMIIQLARQLTGLRVVATASRAETRDWCLGLGAHHVVDHTQPLMPQLVQLRAGPVRYIASLTHTERHFAQLAEVVAPEGAIGVIDDPATLDVVPLKRKSVALAWELMFTRTLYQTADLAAQGRILAAIARFVDEGVVRGTASERLPALTVANLQRAHAAVESARMRGKLVLGPIG
jgi:zinc-binding alcohol dehydrogenase family protein